MLLTLKVNTDACAGWYCGCWKASDSATVWLAGCRYPPEATRPSAPGELAYARKSVAVATSRAEREMHMPVRLPTVADVPRLGIGMTSKRSPGCARRSGTIRRELSRKATLPRSNLCSGVRRSSWAGVRVPEGCRRARTVEMSDCTLASEEKANEVGAVSSSKGVPPP